MDSSSTKPLTGRRFSFQSLRSNASTTALSQDPHTAASNLHQPDAGLFAHRTLLHSARASKPPTSGTVKAKAASNATPSSTSSSGHQHQRSMPSDLSSLLGTVKRSLSFDRSRKSKADAKSPISAYVGTTAEEDAARIYGLSPQRPLLPSPTFEQIASGMAVRSNRASPRLPSEHHVPQVPRRSSMKKPSFSTTNSSSTDFSHSGSSSPSPYFSLNPNAISAPHPRQLKHVTSTLASASSSSTCTSSSTSFSSSGVLPPVASSPLPERKSHKLSLSLSTIKTRRASRNTNANANASMILGTTNSSSSVESSVYWGGAAGIDVSAKKAVRFSESEDGHALNATPPSSNSPAVVVLDPASLTTTATKRQDKKESRPQLVHLNSSSFADRTPKFLRR